MFQNWIICFRSLIRVTWILLTSTALLPSCRDNVLCTNHCPSRQGRLFCRGDTDSGSGRMHRGQSGNEGQLVERQKTCIPKEHVGTKDNSCQQKGEPPLNIVSEKVQSQVLFTGSSHLSYGENLGLATETVSAPGTTMKWSLPPSYPLPCHLRRLTLV